MINWIDIVIAIIIIYNLVRGFALGFVRLVFGILGYFAAFFVSKEYYKLVTEYMLTNFYYFADFKNTIVLKISESFSSGIQNSDISETLSTGFKLPKLLGEDINRTFGLPNAPLDFTNLASSISDFIIYGIGFIIVFLGVIFVVKVIGIILNSFAELPIIKEFNRLGGFVFGGVKGILFIFLIMTVLTFLSPAISDTVLMEALQNSKFGIYFYNNNLLLKIINIYLLS